MGSDFVVMGRGTQRGDAVMVGGVLHGWEWGTVVADPLDANIVYASGNGILKVSYPSEQWISVSPAANASLRLRTTSSQPLAWSPWDRHELITGFQFVMSTTDGGAHWTQSSKDPRVVASNYFSRVFADPTNAGTVYVVQTSMYRSTDGGRTFEAYVGAPSGDDFHVLWIDPQHGQIAAADARARAVIGCGRRPTFARVVGPIKLSGTPGRDRGDQGARRTRRNRKLGLDDFVRQPFP